MQSKPPARATPTAVPDRSAAPTHCRNRDRVGHEPAAALGEWARVDERAAVASQQQHQIVDAAQRNISVGNRAHPMSILAHFAMQSSTARRLPWARRARFDSQPRPDGADYLTVRCVSLRNSQLYAVPAAGRPRRLQRAMADLSRGTPHQSGSAASSSANSAARAPDERGPNGKCGGGDRAASTAPSSASRARRIEPGVLV